MELIALIITGVLYAAYLYHLGSEHAKDQTALKSQVRSLRDRLHDYKTSLEGKNEYIKELETKLLATATTDELSELLTGLFSPDKNGLLVPDMSSIPGPYEANPDLLRVYGQELPETD